MREPLTTVLNNGLHVLAKQTKYGISPYTFSNRTQAERRQGELGEGWAVWYGSRPFYVVQRASTGRKCQ